MKIPLIGFALAMSLTACGPKPPTQQPLIEVWKSPTCSCCSKWITHLKDNASLTEVRPPNGAVFNNLLYSPSGKTLLAPGLKASRQVS